MNYAKIVFTCIIALAWFPMPAISSEKVSESDWPWWRGPNRNGIANANQKPPTTWSETENVAWKTPIPGRGHGSPILVGNRIYLATAVLEKQTQSILCYDRETGKQVWATVVHQGGLDKGGNGKASLASSTAACDGERVYINFLNNKAIYATALNLKGELVWQKRVADYILHQGFASSPTVYQSLLLVSADNKGTGVVAGLDRATGEFVWKDSRPKLPNYASPIVLNVAGKDQMFQTGCNLVAGYEPLTGKKFWEIKGSTEETVTSVVSHGDMIFISGGYPKNHVTALKADGSGSTVWSIPTRVYVPSMISFQGHLYAVQDGGIASCWDCTNGKEKWKQRLEGEFSSSPVLVGDTLFAVNESGRSFVWKATPEGYQELAQNKLGDSALATPTIVGGRIYMRVAHNVKGKREEMLYCLGK